MSLVNLTFDWLQKEWANEVDFVVCEFEIAISLRMMVVDRASFGLQRDGRQRKVRVMMQSLKTTKLNSPFLLDTISTERFLEPQRRSMN